MRDEPARVYLSALDEERFGIRTAKAFGITMESLPETLTFCEKNKVELLIARCSTMFLNMAQELERRGFLLMDTIVYYGCNLKKTTPYEYATELTIRSFLPGEEQIIRRIAAESYKDYMGHYHADDKLDKAKCDDVYIDWSYRCCLSKEMADDVFVAEFNGKIIGYGAIRANSPNEGQYIIAGTLKEFRGRGAYRTILIHCMRWCIERDIETLLSVTQITNIAVQKIWIRLGFEPMLSFYTFHKWFPH